MKIKIFLIILFITLFYGCNPESITVSTNSYKGKGIIQKAVNSYVIDSDDGRKFLPVNLSEEFKVVNLRVEFEGTIEKDNTLPSNIEAIRLTSIKKL